MNEEKVSLRYARAVFELAQEQKNANQILDDFLFIDNSIKASKELSLFLTNPVIKADKKKKIIDEIYNGKINDLTLKLMLNITEKGREVLIPSIANQYKIIYNEAFRRIPVKIITAHEISDTQKQNIIAKLSDWLKMEILPDYLIDKSVIGGIKFLISDKIIDSTVKNQLEKIKNSMIFGI